MRGPVSVAALKGVERTGFSTTEGCPRGNPNLRVNLFPLGCIQALDRARKCLG